MRAEIAAREKAEGGVEDLRAQLRDEQAAHGRLRTDTDERQRLFQAFAHDLRSPLTAMRLQIDTLRRGRQESDSERRALALLDRNLHRLDAFADDVLHLARLEAGQGLGPREPVDVAEVVRAACEALGPSVEEARLSLRPNVVEEPLVIDGQPQRLVQVLDNLLSNAIKYTQPGGRIDVAVQQEQGRAVVQVQDTGRGFRPEDRARLFQPFVRLAPDAATGTGLGLYISRGFVEAMGGTMWGESPGPGRGATFGFALPLRATAQVSSR